MKRAALLIAHLVFASAALAAGDPADMEGSSDHPDIPRFPGFYIDNYEHQDFNSHSFYVLNKAGEAEEKTVEGRFWRISYFIKDGQKEPSPLQLFRNHENAIKKRGGKTLWTEDVNNSGQGSFVMPVGKGERYLQMRVGNGGGMYELIIVEPAAMKQELEFSATQMKEALDRDGFLALYGIQFDTGKDVIKPESEPLLKEIVSLLKENGGLKLSVEGHTDNVGNAKANKKLSEKRADSVKKWLVKNGIPGARLSTAGHGPDMPIADNRLETGRAKNRRVELVKKK